MAEPVLNVQMLGGFSMQVGQTPLARIPSRPAISLLAFLILRRARPQTRDLLAGRFWPNLAESTARERLNNALWQIRKSGRAVGLELLESSADTIGISSSVHVAVDLDHFMHSLGAIERSEASQSPRTDELTRIVGLYHGDLLSGYYDEWIEEERRPVRARYLRALARLVDLCEADGDEESALRHAETLVTKDPLSEEWHRKAIRLAFQVGGKDAAERQYDTCVRDLADSEIVPSPETRALIDRIKSEPTVISAVTEEPGGGRDKKLPFVGRQVERSQLVRRINELRTGNGGIVLVEGEAGIGKSRLLDEVANAAEWRELIVLRAGHHAASSLSPYGALRDALAPTTSGLRAERLIAEMLPAFLGRVAQVFPELQPMLQSAAQESLRPEDEPWRMTEALAQMVLAQGYGKPVVLILEDLHFCDQDTIEVLLRLGESLIESQIVVLLSYDRAEARRTPAIWNALGDLEAMPGSSRIALGPLDEGEVQVLVREHLGPGRVPQAIVSELARSTRGNPYLVLEFLRYPDELSTQLIRELGDGTAASPAGPSTVGRDDSGLLAEIMPHLASGILRRFDAASPGAREVLQATAVLDSAVSVASLMAVTGLDRGSVLDALSEAIELGFLTEEAGWCHFGQEKTRSIVHEHIPAGLRRDLHRAAFDVLDAVDTPDASRLAHHAQHSHEWELAHTYQGLAARSARDVNAYRLAAEHLIKADDAASRCAKSDVDRLDDLLLMEEMLALLGRRDEQGEVLDRLAALDSLDATSVRTIRERQAWMLAHSAEGAAAIQLATEAITAASRAGLPTGELWAIVGHAQVWTGDMESAIGSLITSMKEFRRAGSSGLTALVMLGRTYADLNDYELAQRHLSEAYELAVIDEDARSQVDALGFRASTYVMQAESSRAEPLFEEALQLAAEIGYRYAEGLNLVNFAGMHLDIGRGGRAHSLFDDAATVFASLGHRRGEAFVKLNLADLVHQLLGDDAQARSLAEEAAVFFRKVEDARREAACLVIMASIERRNGRRPLARRLLSEAATKAEATADVDTRIQVELHRGLVALDLGHYDETLAHIGDGIALSEEASVSAVMPALLATKARVLARTGDLREAVTITHQVMAMSKDGVEQAHIIALRCSEVLLAAGELGDGADQVLLAFRLLETNLADLPDDLRDEAWTSIPEHREIVEAHEQYFVDEIDVLLPKVDAPMGRKVTDADCVWVTWSVSQPEDHDAITSQARRHRRILRLTEQATRAGAIARVSDLARVLRVADRTIKRDLATLRAGGHRPVTRGHRPHPK